MKASIRSLSRASTPVARAWDIAHVMFARPDLDRASRFLLDFGLTEGAPVEAGRTFWATGGYGPNYILKLGKPRFLGLGLALSSEGDLERLAGLPGASAIEPAEGWPDGRQVRLTDPAGNAVRALLGPKAVPRAPRSSLAQNLDGQLARLNAEQRPSTAPATILRLGHVVLNAVDFFRCSRWYLDNFGLLASDIQTIGDGDPALVFLRCNRGEIPTDHHSLVIAQNVTNDFGHAAFECIDLDDIAMGQEWLKAQGWKHAWGVGRHLLGSQIFDYWRDPWGSKVEHFVDSDMYTEAKEAAVTPLTAEGLYQWGPPVPADFEKPRLTPAFLWRMVRNVRASDEMSFARLRQLMQAIG
jgi:catechol 2,3-dioxygenase-like lactoylglutathione lyase family enzyme